MFNTGKLKRENLVLRTERDILNERLQKAELEKAEQRREDQQTHRALIGQLENAREENRRMHVELVKAIDMLRDLL